MRSSDTRSSDAGSERAILLFTCVAHALTHAYMLIFTALQTEMGEDFGLERDTFLEYATISTVLFGVGAVPAGWLGDRIGEKAMLVAFFFLTALGGTLLGLAGGTVGLAVGMALVGAGASIFHPVGNAMISKGIRAPGWAMGVNGLFGSLGIAAGPVIAVQVAELLDWRWAYWVLTPPMVLLGVWLAFTRMGSSPADEPAPPGGSAAEADRPAAGETEPAASPGGNSREWKAMIFFLLCAMTCGGFFFHLITTMLPEHFQERVTFSDEFRRLTAGYLTGTVYAIGGLGQLLSGYLVHRREGRGLYMVVLVLAAPLVYSISVLSELPVVAAAAVMSVFIFMAQPIENVLLSRYSPRRIRGLLFGLKFILAFGVGGLGAALSGYVSEWFSVAAVFVVASGFTALAAVFAFLAYRTRRVARP